MMYPKVPNSLAIDPKDTKVDAGQKKNPKESQCHSAACSPSTRRPSKRIPSSRPASAMEGVQRQPVIED